MSSKEYLHIVTQDHIPVQKMRFGRALIWGSAGIFFCLVFLQLDRKSTRLNSSHSQQSRMPSSA